jgi:hypothetical protein
MTARGRYALSIFFALLLGPLPALAQAPTPAERPILVKEIAVQGNRRVQEAVILGRVGLKIGAPFVANRTAEDIRAIFSLGFFDDVQVRVEDFEGGVKLTYVVTERPFIRDVLFSGNKKQDSSTLLEKITLKLGTVYNPVEVNRAADNLKDFYEQEGYFEVAITPEVEKLADGDVTVTFKIAEGRRITIEQIVIEGTQGLTPRQVRAAMDTREREFYVLRGTVQRQRLDEDVDRIIQLYNDNGYVQARVEKVETEVDRDKAHAIIRIVVVEGPQFKVGGVDVTGNCPARRGDPQAHPAQVGRRLQPEQAPRQRHRHHRALQRDRSGVRRRRPQHDAGHPQPPGQRRVRDRGGPGDLRRAHQHHGQHPQRGEDPAPRDPDGGGRSLHQPEARAGQAAAHQPQLLRQGRGQDRAGLGQGQDHRQHRRDREAHRAVLDRRRL